MDRNILKKCKVFRNRPYRITPSKIIAMHFDIVLMITKAAIMNNKLIQTDRAESRGKLKQTSRQASLIYLYIK